MPLDPAQLVTPRGGQVAGLGRSAVQSILGRHGIHRVLAAEGGRTSRGSLENMRKYSACLNELGADIDLERVETFWIERVREFFAGKPFRISLDPAASVRAVVRNLIEQATNREREVGGVHYAGAVLQHLVGATLDSALGPDQIEHNSFSTADAPKGRVGDFAIGDIAIHVTMLPGTHLLERCRDNLEAGLRPVIITRGPGSAVAHELAHRYTIEHRIDVFEIGQFVAISVYNLGMYAAEGRRAAIRGIVQRYNEIIDRVETDPSIKIDLRA
ncbi:DUF4928 family protein [Candidatus Palauibacter sp.]|uniref:DUF4928 family protein n=1 Tax=Candidatus Palauibacter sp. TaxID=3101350 RepID=UPI003B027B90